ncbi:MAG TPA: hypothetical protein VFV78_06095 [Vicinamibacterales bacterium]|nr:hypothetical protein [Vicinamibacterales bacterium]
MRTDNDRKDNRPETPAPAIRDTTSVREPGEAVADDAALAADDRETLFEAADAEGYRTRWSGIQTGFVDEPRRAVEEADALVTEVIQRLTTTFSDERRRLETQWSRDDRVSTEDLRQAMRRYRSFFERMLEFQDRRRD